MSASNIKATLFHRSAYMSEEDLLVAEQSCPFCSSEERSTAAVLQVEPEVLLLYCNNCHAASASRMPRTEALSNYYAQYYDSFGEEQEKVTLDAPERMANHIIQHAKGALGDLKGREIFFLDYGGGDGSIALAIADGLLGLGAAKVNIALVDYDESRGASSGDRIKISRPRDLSEIREQSMDLVIASAVIEHIPGASEILNRLLSMVKKNGVFYARTPYVIPLSRVASALGISFDFTFPAHVHDLGAKFWNNVLTTLPVRGQLVVLRSTPSIVETSFSQNFWRTLIAHVLKVPGYIFPHRYGLVGGWEVFLRRVS